MPLSDPRLNQLDLINPLDKLINRIEKIMASIRTKVEHPFRAIKRQFGHIKTRYKGLMTITRQLHELFAPCNLWMVRGKLMQVQV
ncbi:MAG: transposase [Rhizobacter sp.]